jgi:hypothetical protein
VGDQQRKKVTAEDSEKQAQQVLDAETSEKHTKALPLTSNGMLYFSY